MSTFECQNEIIFTVLSSSAMIMSGWLLFSTFLDPVYGFAVGTRKFVSSNISASAQGTWPWLL